MLKIVSAHSFRGGFGKSSTTANLATSLARNGLKVGVVDTDIASPGIHIKFVLKYFDDPITKSLENLADRFK